jgi:hypothetical protein
MESAQDHLWVNWQCQVRGRVEGHRHEEQDYYEDDLDA